MSKKLLGRVKAASAALLLTFGVMISYVPAVHADSQYPQMVSVTANGTPGDGSSGMDAMRGVQISDSGRYIAYMSRANNLGGQRTDAIALYIHDRTLNTTTLASAGTNGQQENGYLLNFALSGDGRHIVFISSASNLGISSNNFCAYSRNLDTGATTVVSIDNNGSPICGGQFVSISDDGNLVAFHGAPNTGLQYVRNLAANTTTQLPVGGEAPVLSGDGSSVAYRTLFGQYPNSQGNQVVAYNIATGQSTLVSATMTDSPGNGQSGSGYGNAISDNGRYVVFWSNASDLLPGSPTSCAPHLCGRLYRRDLVTNTTQRVDVTDTGADFLTNGSIESLPSISDDGSIVAFSYYGDSQPIPQVAVHSFQDGTTRTVSLNSQGEPADKQTNFSGPALNGDGSFVAFPTQAQNFGIPFVACPWSDPGMPPRNCANIQVFVNPTRPVLSVSAISAPIDPLPINSAVSTSATFVGTGTALTHTAVWDWGDSTSSNGNVTEVSGSGSVAGNHTYTQAGVYTVKLTVTESNGSSATSTYQYVVIYNPSTTASFTASGAFVTEAGEYIASPGDSGQTLFGISSRYTNGTLSARVRLNFKPGNFEFNSTSCSWLVVNGAIGQIKCSGTVNGTSGYTLVATGLDGSQSGGEDAIRFKVSNASGTAVYDTQVGAGDSATPATPIRGGTVTVHN